MVCLGSRCDVGTTLDSGATEWQTLNCTFPLSDAGIEDIHACHVAGWAFVFSTKPHVRAGFWPTRSCKPWCRTQTVLLTPFNFVVCAGPPFRKCSSSTEPTDIANWEMIRITSMDNLLAFYEYVYSAAQPSTPGARGYHISIKGGCSALRQV